jgi:DNA-binding CsgD family transcriptional regulator/tetratricopeptide (TPR) repeat protein
VPAATAWPFVGRHDLLERLDTALADRTCGGAVIVGAAGIGKTRLADEFLVRVAPQATARVTGTPGTHTIPYSAIAHLVQNDTFDVAAGADPARVLSDVRETLGAGPTVLMADDVTWVDDASISLIGHLLNLGEIFLVATMRTGTTMSPALDSLARSYRIEFLHPSDLTDEELVEAAEIFLGADLDPRSADRIGRLCSGNPLYLRELLLHGTTSGHITVWPSGFAWIEPDLTPAARLVELVEERTRALDPDSRDLLRLLAVAEEASMSDLERLGQLDQAVDLERLGWLRVDGERADPVVRLAHPLHAEVLRTSLGKIDQRRQLLRAIDMVASRPVPHGDDALRLSIWRLDAGEAIEDVGVLLAAARNAMAVFDLESTIRLATAVEQVAPTPESQYLLMNSLYLLGRFDESITVAERPLPDDVDITQLMLHTSVHLYSLLWGSCDADLAAEALERVRPLFASRGMEVLADYMLGLLWANDGRVVAAAEILGPSPADPMLQFLSSTQRSTAWLMMGRVEEACAEADRSRFFLDSFPDPRSVMNPGFFALTSGSVRSSLGDFDGAVELLSSAHVSAREDRVTFLRAMVSVFLGENYLRRGHLDEAEVWYLDAIDASTSVGLRTTMRIATGGLAAVAGQRNDSSAARAHLDALEELGNDLAFLRLETVVGEAWARHALGDTAGARAVLLDETRVAEEGQLWLLAARGALELSRLGDHRVAGEVMERIPPVDGDLVAAWRAFVAAFKGRSADRFAEAHRAAQAIGADLLAAEAAAGWAEALRRDGDGRGASTATAASAKAVERCTGAATPLLAVASPVVLSRREREIGQLAADGLSNVEIAERLYLSRRTVENHLQRVYVKLGVASRTELTAAL